MIHSSRHQPLLVTLVALCLPLVLLGACERAPADSTQVAVEDQGLVVVDPQFPEAPDELDLGHVLLGRVIDRQVQLKNTSAVPITIRNVRPGCSCTTPRMSFTDPASGELVRGSTVDAGDVITVPPGVTANLDLRIDTSVAPAKNKSKNVIVRITTDSPETPYLTLNVFMFIESYFQPNPAVIDLKDVARNGGGAGQVVIALDNEDGRYLTGVERSPLELVPTLEEQNVGGTKLWTLKVKLLPPLEPGRREYEILLSTSGSQGEGEGVPFPVKVRALALEDAGIEPAMILLSEPDDGGPVRGEARVITRLPGNTLHVKRAFVEGDRSAAVRVDLVAQRPDSQGRAASWGVSIVATEDLGDENVGGTLVIETDDDQHPRLEARWLYRPVRN